MDMGGDRGERAAPADDSGSGISRRHFLAGGLMVIGGSAMLVSGKTGARFADEAAGSGIVQIDGNPTLNYLLTDNTANQKAQWNVSYQVEWVQNFDHLEIYLDNNPNGSPDPPGQESQRWTNLTKREGTVISDEFGGHADETWEFIFRVYDGSGTLVVEEIVTDVANGDNQQQGDFGSTTDTQLSSITVIDDNGKDKNDSNRAVYTVEYELDNVQSDFADVLVTFDNQTQTNWGNATRTSTTSPSGSVSFEKGGTGGDTYEITVEVRNNSGIAVDSHTVTDEVDGNNQNWSA